MALNLHGLARSTEDLDLFVEPEAANIERLRLALHDTARPQDKADAAALRLRFDLDED